MYICLDCGIIFEEPRKYFETHGFSEPPYEEFTCCPMCGGSFAETMECDSCGKYIHDEYVKIGRDCYCSNCYEIHEIGY